MKKDKLKLYFFEIIFLIILFIALFVSSKISSLLLASIIMVFCIVVKLLFKKKKIIQTSSKEVMYLMIGLGLLYVGIFYLLGLIHFNFNQHRVLFGFKTIINFIIPYTIIIISSEVIRYTLISQNGKIRIKNTNNDYSHSLTFIIMVLIDLIIYTGVYDLGRLEDFLAVVGFISFASISCNLFYNYYTKRFGVLGIIFYRMITILYVYLIPVIPDMYIYFRSFLRMLYPYIMFLVLDNTFGKKNFVVPYYERRKNVFFITSLIIIMSALTMLISCQFRYGVLVIGSDSMKGELERGDVTFYESYHHQDIRNGDIIIFNYDNIQIVHRVVEIKNVNGEVRYYTKGDQNQYNDPEYRTSNNIVGVSLFKIKYIGIPTLLFNSLFN